MTSVRTLCIVAAALFVAVLVTGTGLASPNRGAVRPDDRAGLRVIAPAVRPEAAASAPNIGFQWGDAGVGAGTAAAILLLAGCGFAVVRRGVRERPQLRGTT
jgi:hypothetical protein